MQTIKKGLASGNIDVRTFNLSDVSFKAPIPDSMEVEAAGVTYDSSREQREAESAQANFRSTENKSVYSDIYDRGLKGEAPEIFGKGTGKKSAANGEFIGIRSDSEWNVPEPEFTIVYNSKGERVGYTIGNDMSSRDIEGKNPLYLPQAKVYHRSLAMGPFLAISENQGIDEEHQVRDWTVKMEIEPRENRTKRFEGQTQVSKISRSFDALKKFLFRSRHFENGVALLTGTGIIPPKDFSLEDGDHVKITIGPIGTLENKAKLLPETITNKEAKDMKGIQFERLSYLTA